MKINGLLGGLLGLLISILSIGSVAEATQVGQAIYGQPIYQSSSVVPATYVAPATTTVSSPVSTTSYYRPIVSSPTSLSSTSFASNTGSGLAQSKAARAARMGLRGHLGGGLGGARYEGVGWSNRSAQSAIQSCCYWGARPVSEIGVSRGNDGYWYACVLYR